MKVKIEIKNRFTGEVLFELETENNTIKNTLHEAYMQGADLQCADLRGAYLQGAYLQCADLQDADLRGADLQGADLQDAYLRGAYLQGAYLQGAYLRGADLQGAYLQGAYLRGAFLRDADLRGAYLQGAKIKKALVFTGLYQYIVIPYITEDNEKRIKMGCFDRSLQEWTDNFWNNDSEFPNDGSLKSEMRVMAFNTAKAWFELIDKTNTDEKNS